MQRMAEQVIERNPSVSSITYRLPKRHYVPVPYDSQFHILYICASNVTEVFVLLCRLDYVGLSNTQPGEAEVFCPMDAPGCVFFFICLRVLFFFPCALVYGVGQMADFDCSPMNRGFTSGTVSRIWHVIHIVSYAVAMSVFFHFFFHFSFLFLSELVTKIISFVVGLTDFDFRVMTSW